MRAADESAAKNVGTIALMRAAGRRLAEYVERATSPGRVVAFAGPGNNGGDAFAAFAELPPTYERVVYADEAPHASEARADAQARARAAGVVTLPLPVTENDARDALRGAALVLDALFGTGARLPVEARYAGPIAAMNACGAGVVAVDIPSGIDAESGAIVEPAVRAGATVTLGALKIGLLLEPARDCVGALWLADIGIDASALASTAHVATLDDVAFLELLPVRANDADKRSSGAPLVVAGSEQFPGAAVLCARAAARAGAGYVTVATAARATQILRTHLVEQVVVSLPDGNADEVAGDLIDIARRNGSVAIGPGLALDDRTGEILRAFVGKLDLPFVLDASGLFHFAKHLDVLAGKRCVVTPHAGEFARLSGKGSIAPGTRVERLHEFVARSGVTTLLKGPATLVFDGTTTYVNPTGTSALATAGTGDVLTGIIATLLSQGLSPFDAACAGAYWHGLAGLHARAARPRGVMAGDLPDLLAAALPVSHERPQLFLIDNRDA